MSTEVAAKSEHIKVLRAEIEKLESEKARILDWVRGKEKEVDALNKRANEILDEIEKEKKAFEIEKSALRKEQENIKLRTNAIEHVQKETESKLQSVLEKERQQTEFQWALREQETRLSVREAAVERKEKWIQSVFDGIEAIKNEAHK